MLKTLEAQMTTISNRNRLLPLYLGAAVLAVLEFYIGLNWVDEGAAEFAQQAMLVVLPVVMLPLMFLTFTSQK
jgi:Mn2+/Fe2+ NRAMP family transporter